MKYESYSVEETKKIAYEFAKTLHAGDIVCLNGDLGAGKTAFTSGFVKAFNYKGYVSSPTFTLINEYQADLPIYHFDVYRIEMSDEMIDIGIDEYLFGDGICLIEWSEKIRNILPDKCIYVDILKNDEKGENYRGIVIYEDGEKK